VGDGVTVELKFAGGRRASVRLDGRLNQDELRKFRGALSRAVSQILADPAEQKMSTAQRAVLYLRSRDGDWCSQADMASAIGSTPAALRMVICDMGTVLESKKDTWDARVRLYRLKGVKP